MDDVRADLEALLPLGPRALRERLDGGHAIDPAALDDREYHGVALGNPRFVERLTWKTFKKVFRRDPVRGVLRGWNVAVEQRGVWGPWIDRERRGRRVTWGHYEVHPIEGYAVPGRRVPGLMIDYGRGEAGACNPLRLLRDPVVSLHPGRADLLLGFSYLDLGFARVPTPTFFTLVRGAPLTYDVPPPR